MKRVTLYTRQECHLCEHAKEVLERVRKDTPFVLDEHVLQEGEPSFDRYQELVPVVTIDGEFAFKYRVDESRLREMLTREGKREAT